MTIPNFYDPSHLHLQAHLFLILLNFSILFDATIAIIKQLLIFYFWSKHFTILLTHLCPHLSPGYLIIHSFLSVCYHHFESNLLCFIYSIFLDFQKFQDLVLIYLKFFSLGHLLLHSAFLNTMNKFLGSCSNFKSTY